MSQNRETLQIPRSASNLFPKSECRAPGLVLVRQAPVHSSSSKIKHFYSFEVSCKRTRYGLRNIYLRICRRMSTPWPRPRGSVLTTQTPTTPTPTPPCPTPATTGRLGRQPASRVNKTLNFQLKSALVSSTENKFMFRVTSLFPADRT